MARTFLIAALCWGCVAAVAAHNIGVTPITWNREISRLIYDKCASCHRPEGSAFSLMTYRDVQPRVTEIKAAVLSRRMPPWGAIKGFGDFRNDEALTPEQIELFVDWIQNDAPRGNNRQALPAEPKFSAPAAVTPPAHVVSVSGSLTLDRPTGPRWADAAHGAARTIDANHGIASKRGDAAAALAARVRRTVSTPISVPEAIRLPAGTVIRGSPLVPSSI